MKNSYHFLLLIILPLFWVGCRTSKDSKRAARNTESSTVLVKKIAGGGDVTTITGQAKDRATGEPLMNVVVVLYNTNVPTTGALSDSDGNFTISNIPYGSYSIEIRYTGHETIRMPLEIKPKNRLELDVRLFSPPIRLEKPVIYLYPTDTQKIAVQLLYDGILQHTYPAYGAQGWQVTAAPNGTLWDKKGQTYYALFWEGQPNWQIKPTNGFIVRGDETALFLEEKLAYLGLNRREANEFIMYWLPRMEGNTYNFVHFAGADYERLAELQISPKPETTIRVMMLTQPLAAKIDCSLQDLRPLHKMRKGYTVVEWGGTVINSIQVGRL